MSAVNAGGEEEEGLVGVWSWCLAVTLHWLCI